MVCKKIQRSKDAYSKAKATINKHESAIKVILEHNSEKKFRNQSNLFRIFNRAYKKIILPHIWTKLKKLK